MEAGLLVVLLACLAILLQGAPESLDGVRGCHRQLGGLSDKAALYFRREGCSMFFYTEERSMFPLTVMTPRGPGILSLRYA